jgi:hypothetical protein
MAIGLFVPEYLWYGSLVLKEVHNGFLFALFFVCFSKLASRGLAATSARVWIGGLFLAIAGISVFQRAHVVTMMIFAVVGAMVAAKPGARNWVIIAAALSLGVVLAAEFLLVSDWALVASENAYVVAGVVSPDDQFVSSDSSSINALLSGGTMASRLLFAVPRALIMMVTPFPRLGLWELGAELNGKWFAAGQAATRLSVIMFLASLPAFFAGSIGCIVMPALRPARLLAIVYGICILAISNGVLMFQERWRSTLWPFWLALVILGWPYRKKFQWILFVVPFAVVLFLFVKEVS